MLDKGLAHMGVGYGKGDSRASDAVRQAIASPLLETSINGATGVILNFTGGSDLGALEVYEAADVVRESSDPDANIIFGAVIDETLNDEIRITVIATGFEIDKINVIPEEKKIEEKVKPIVTEPVEHKQVETSKEIYEESQDLDIPVFLRRTKK
jgi:cell division protein FtsZ